MKKLLTLFAVLALAFAVFAQVTPAAAFATTSSYSASCSSFSASGTTDAPYVVLWAEYYNGSVWVSQSQVFPNASGSYSHSISFPAFPEGSLTGYYVWGSPTNDVDDWDSEDYFYVELNCKNDVPGPGVPSGFVLRTIICDVAVYNTPAGSPVGDARIRAGQTWFVSPTSIAGTDGEGWTEIFAGGRSNGFVPSACVSLS